jgi:hypothetical protein
VSENRVESIDGVFCNHLCLQRLKLATNRLFSLAPLPWLPHLRSLDISDNPITIMPPFILQPALTALNISFCHLNQDTILGAVAPLVHLVNLQAHDNSAPQVQPDAPDSSTQHVPSATLCVLPWLQELDHMETRCCDVISAALKAFSQRPHLLLSWRRKILSGMHHMPPISTSSVTAMSAQTDPVRQFNEDEKSFSVSELLVMLGLHRGVRTLIGSDTSASHGKNPSISTLVSEQHTAAQLHAKLQEQKSLLTAHSGACTGLLRSLVSGVDVDQSLCIEQLNTAVHQAQASAAASVLNMMQWRPQEEPSLVHVNAEWQESWYRKRHEAAARLQRAWRRQHACRKHELHRRKRATVCIQSSFRGAQVRKQNLLLKLRQELNQRQEGAATVIQAVWRGYRVRGLLSRARVAAHHIEMEGTQGQGDSRRASISASDSDISLPELGNDLKLELDLLESFPATYDSSGSAFGLAGQIEGVLSTRATSMAAGSRCIDTLKSEKLPQLSTQSTFSMTPAIQQQNVELFGKDDGGTGVGGIVCTRCSKLRGFIRLTPAEEAVAVALV